VLKNRAALAFRAHSGWAAMVALGGPINAPRVILRRHLTITSGVKQPYHAAASMPFSEAGGFITRCADSALSLAINAVREAVTELSAMGFDIAGTCVLMGSGRPAGDLARILSSHPLIHTAEGEFYRTALRDACHSCGVPCIGIKEKDLSGHKHLSLVSRWGKTMGPPWREDQKLCAAAACLLLSSRLYRPPISVFNSK
jgi:hypothetical protein